MKNTIKIILIALFMIIYMSTIQAQTTEQKLDQVELMKKFIGNWKGDFGDSLIFSCNNKAFGNGIISNSQISAKGKIIETVAQLYGYDKKTDKFIIAELKTTSPVIEICSTWFTTKTSGVIIITNPDNAPFKFKFEFLNPDMIEQSAIKDNRVVNKIILKRI